MEVLRKVIHIPARIEIIGAVAASDPPDLATSTPGQNLTFPLPVGTEPGDQAYVAFSDSSSGTATVPTGFSLDTSVFSNSSQLYKNTNIADPVPASYTWVHDVTDRARSGVMVIVRGSVLVETTVNSSQDTANTSLTVPQGGAGSGGTLLVLSTSLNSKFRDMSPNSPLVKLVDHGAKEDISYGQHRNSMASAEENSIGGLIFNRSINFDGAGNQVVYGVFLRVA